MKPIKLRRNWLDHMISFVNPVSGLKRDRARIAQSLVEETIRKYEAGSAGNRTGGWVTAGSGSANAEVGPALHRVRDRCRDLVRNNPYAGRAVSVIESNVIGTGILGHAKTPDESRAKAYLKTIGAWKDWCEGTDCDVDGLHNFYGLQALAARTVAESGECIIRRRYKKGLKVPLQLQVLEGDYIDTTRTYETTPDGGFIMQGIEFDKTGRRVAYWLWNVHPGEVLITPRNSIVSSRVPVEEVLHIYRVDRPGQVRGIAWGSPCVIRLRDFDEYEDAQLMRQKIAACFAGFVGDMEAPGDGVAANNKFPEDLSPGTVEILPPGKTITFPNVPQVNDEGHSTRVLRGIAMGYGLTYEAVSGDLSNVNFSSGRMGWIEMSRNIQKWQWLLYMPRMNTPVANWWLQAADLAGFVTDGISFCWTPPKREMIDPTKEVPAKIAEVRGGLTSLSEAIRENGFIPEDLFAEIKQDADTLDSLDLKLDSDPRYIAKGGSAQSSNDNQGGSEDGGKTS